MSLTTKKMQWGHEIGRISRCDWACGHNITEGEYYEFVDHLMHDITHEGFVTVIGDNGNETTVPLKCFILEHDDERAA